MNFAKDTHGLSLSLVQSEGDLRAAQRLRYDVFVTELGGCGTGVDHDQRLETDRFDAFADHLILRDAGQGRVVGVYRVLTTDQAHRAGGFYTETEFDLEPLKRSGRPMLELGRSCIAPEYRGGTAMFQLWSGLAQHVARHGAELLFGTASLKGTDMTTLAGPLSLLHHRHLAPEELRPQSRAFQSMNLTPADQLDRRAAMVAMPSLIKSYLRLGGGVGEGAYVDPAFNCTDVCMVMDTATLNDQMAQRYLRSPL